MMSHFVLRLVGWTALQFAWQGAAAAVLTVIGTRMLAGHPAILRYRLALTGLCALIVIPPLTFAAGQWSAMSAAIASAGSPAGPAPTLWWIWVAAWGWAAGAVVTGCRLVLDWRRLGDVISEATAEPSLPGMVSLLAERLRMNAIPRVLESAAVTTPLAAGWRMPVIVFPAGMTAALSADELSAVLLHELAHVRRQDYAINFLQRCVEVLLWFHPAVWLLSRMARIEREHCCDEEAVRASARPISLARALVALEERRGGFALALAGSGGELGGRVIRILQQPERNGSHARALPIAGGLTLAVVGMVAASARLAASNQALAAAAPVVTIHGADPAGRFTLRIVGGKLRGAALDGTRVPDERLRQEGTTLSLLDPHGRSELTLHMARGGYGIDWEPRAPR